MKKNRLTQELSAKDRALAYVAIGLTVILSNFVLGQIVGINIFESPEAREERIKNHGLP